MGNSREPCSPLSPHLPSEITKDAEHSRGTWDAGCSSTLAAVTSTRRLGGSGADSGFGSMHGCAQYAPWGSTLLALRRLLLPLPSYPGISPDLP